MNSAQSFSDKAAVFLATLGPIGHLPKAPGTWGSLAAILLAPACFLPAPFWMRIAILILIFGVGTWAASRAETVLDQKDPGCVIIDELLGQWIALLPFQVVSWWVLVLAFVLFRVFDILKPWPVRQAETAFPGGFGVMIDDAVAGGYALLILWLLCLAF
ncbi:phosphatidylglycerophosphatase A family protein [Pseudodesulfovibrio tunisiensis]|uniref:phosphatidylglycerophosphatase A family protein n=1 Tax=Pseudodesulfovibrio tunisiensis TaxID=463192 RepID=UPI001FB33639|nr:phosphatidylglycerophosphatase A [Pseudodesulfovibrio tunisiensis]